MAKRDKPRSNRIGRRDDSIDIREIRRAVKASQGGEPPGIEASELAMRRDLLALRRSLGKRLEPLVAKGVDVTRAKTILADYENRRAQVLKSKVSEIDRAMAALGDSRSQGIAGRRKALEDLAMPGLPFTPTTLTLKPFLIWASDPSNMLLDSHLDPVGYSWAKIWLTRTEDPPPVRTDSGYYEQEMPTLVFYYLWSNPSDYYAVVNVKSSAVFNGICTTTANTGFIIGGWTKLECTAKLVVKEWWNQPPQAWQASGQVFLIVADGGGVWSLETGDLEIETLSGVTRDLRYDLFRVPPGATAVFEVQVRFDTIIDDGSIGIDFSSQPYYSISSFLQLELLTAPPILGTF